MNASHQSSGSLCKMKCYRYASFYTTDDLGKQRLGRACMTIEFNKDEASGEVEYAAGFSFCSPKDIFLKSRGRAISEARLKKAQDARTIINQNSGNLELPESIQLASEKAIFGNFSGEPDKKALTRNDIADILAEAIFSYKLSPNWAVKAYARGDFVTELI